jgi:hypothetical protein
MKLSIQAILVAFLHNVVFHHGALVMAMDSSAASQPAMLDQEAGVQDQVVVVEPVGVENEKVEPGANNNNNKDVVSHNVRRHVQSCPPVTFQNAPSRSTCYSRLTTLGCSAGCTKTGTVSTNQYGIQVWSCACSPP